MMKGQLILIPNVFSQEQLLEQLVPFEYLKSKAQIVDRWVFESRKMGFKLVAKLKEPNLKELPYFELNEHTDKEGLKEIEEALLSGQVLGLIADAGLPCLADPGAKLVLFCRKNQIGVEIVSGPSSIPYAVALSGLSGQRFHFEGYLPKNEEERLKRLLELIERSQKENCTIVMIEAPHHNAKLYQFLKHHLPKKAYLSVASEITTERQQVFTELVQKIDLDPSQLDDRPTIFLFGF